MHKAKLTLIFLAYDMNKEVPLAEIKKRGLTPQRKTNEAIQ